MKLKYTYIAIALIVVVIFILIWNLQPVRPIENPIPIEDTSLIQHSEIPKDTN
jgi:hypothetical protein